MLHKQFHDPSDWANAEIVPLAHGRSIKCDGPTLVLREVDGICIYMYMYILVINRCDPQIHFGRVGL